MSSPHGDCPAISQLARLRGVTWVWREGAPEDAKERPGMGVIAQEVEAVFPELITTTADGLLQIDYDGLVPPLVTATCELWSRLETLDHEEEKAEMTSEHPKGAASRTVEVAKHLGIDAGRDIRTQLDPDEVEKVFPHLVIINREGQRDVAYEGLVGLLIEAVRELDRRLTALEAHSSGSP